MLSSPNENRLSIADLNRLLTPIPVEQLNLVETRSHIKAQLIDVVSSAQASNVLIVGPSGGGKSSLLSKSLLEIALLPNVEHFQLTIVDGNHAAGWLFRAIGRAICGVVEMGSNRDDLASQMTEFSNYSKKIVVSIDGLEAIDDKLLIAELKSFNLFVHSRGVAIHLIGALASNNPSQMVAELLKSKVTAVSLPPMKHSEIMQVISEKIALFPSLKNKKNDAYERIADRCDGNPSLAIQFLSSSLLEGESLSDHPSADKKTMNLEQKKTKPSTAKKQKASFDDFLTTETKPDKSTKKAK